MVTGPGLKVFGWLFARICEVLRMATHYKLKTVVRTQKVYNSMNGYTNIMFYIIRTSVCPDVIEEI